MKRRWKPTYGASFEPTFPGLSRRPGLAVPAWAEVGPASNGTPSSRSAAWSFLGARSHGRRVQVHDDRATARVGLGVPASAQPTGPSTAQSSRSKVISCQRSARHYPRRKPDLTRATSWAGSDCGSLTC